LFLFIKSLTFTGGRNNRVIVLYVRIYFKFTRVKIGLSLKTKPGVEGLGLAWEMLRKPPLPLLRKGGEFKSNILLPLSLEKEGSLRATYSSPYP